ncbi:sensor histidine kinase [Bacillus sp. B1-b2]|uniref:sensor histidine kinase n=1 Tax=Bacillus sp. B1-b2 TaxID=2653201 RepID=UPI0012613E31|nr:sensor histidine kinase [Bacillus sp. B1-b2]KAB7668441.1 HAMP domain-containing histidine kinase [Bacillus sp. B1-b2]
MITTFLLERKSWILFFIIIQFLQLFIAHLDPSLSLTSMLYIGFISSILFIFFLFYRYHKETHFFKALSDREITIDLSSLPDAHSPFENIIENSMVSQIELLKRENEQSSLQLEQEKDELLSWIHEVKTPLTALHLLIQQLSVTDLKAQITYEWLRIHLLLDQQLYHKRITFIENDLYVEYIHLEDLLYDEMKTIQTWCIQKGIGVEINLEVKEVLTDSKWLAFVLRQLLTNAIKYSNKSDIIITSYKENGQVHLAIKDEGIGIDIKDMPRIFEKGFTSTSKHHNNYATGMGLYLTKKVTDALDIFIKVESKLLQGSTFTLIFSEKNEFDQLL